MTDLPAQPQRDRVPARSTVAAFTAVAALSTSGIGGAVGHGAATPRTTPPEPSSDLVAAFVAHASVDFTAIEAVACSSPDAAGAFTCYGRDGATGTLVSADGGLTGAGAPQFSDLAATATAANTTVGPFRDGTYVVGDEIPPGRYVATATDLCSWIRFSDPTAAEGSELGRGFVVEGPAIVDILDGDAAFTSQGCREWTPYEAPATPLTEFGPGAYVVGSDIAPGVYEAPGDGMCGWTRVAAFTGDFDDELGRGYLDGPQIVEILDTDVGFESEGCGTWVPADEQTGELRDTFDDGTFLVGVDVAPGRYVADPPDDAFCNWDRLSGLGGSPEETIGTGFGSGAVTIVDIDAEDFGFRSSGCGTWALYEPPAEPMTSFGDGAYVVGSDIVPGSYEATGPLTDCYWVRLRGFGGGFDEIVTNSLGESLTVTILDRDVGFMAERCGTWTLVEEPAGFGVARDSRAVPTDPTKSFVAFLGTQAIVADRPACSAPLDDGDILCYARDPNGAVVAAAATSASGEWEFELLVGEATLSGFDDGVHEVGQDVVPGRYMATATGDCEWERVGGGDDDGDGAVSSGPVVVDVLDTDVQFVSQGCGSWTPYQAPADGPATTFGDGSYVVGDGIAPGFYQASGSSGCDWARVFAFTGARNDTLATSALVTASPIVELTVDDRGFVTSGCGTWAPYTPGDPATAATTFGDGTYTVGADIAPGRYRTTTTGGFCAWHRVGDFRGDETLGTGWAYDAGIVDILPGDAGFAALGCGTWEPYEPSAEPATTFSEGQFVVGEDIVPGRYVSEGGSDTECFWERVTDFTGSIDATIELDMGGAREVVIEPADGGFITVDCGTWTLT